MDKSQLVFAVIGGAGLLLLAASWLLGVFDFEVDGTDADAGNGMPSFFSFSTLATALVGVGAVGFATTSFGVPLVAAWICAIGGGIGLGYAMLYGVLRPLARQEHSAMIGRSSYAGLVAEVIMTIPGGEGNWGEVKFTDGNGALVTERAWSQQDTGIPKGKKVLVYDVTQQGLIVTPLDLTT